MSEYTKGGKDYIGYEYKEVFAERDKVSMFLDAYENFGWIPDDHTYAAGYTGSINIPHTGSFGKVAIKLKRDRKIINKAELTRLQRHFEACMDAIDELEKSKTSFATMAAIGIGIVGTAFMAGSTFAVTAEPPMILLSILLAVPGFIGWIMPYFVYKLLVKRKMTDINLLIDQKYDEIYEICEKGCKLL